MFYSFVSSSAIVAIMFWEFCILLTVFSNDFIASTHCSFNKFKAFGLRNCKRLTTIPPCITADGKPKIPVPTNALKICVRTCHDLYIAKTKNLNFFFHRMDLQNNRKCFVDRKKILLLDKVYLFQYMCTKNTRV